MPIRFFFSEAINSLMRNWVMSMAAVVTVLVSMFILGVGTFIFFNVQAATDEVIGKLEIEVFIESAASEEEVDQLGDELDSMPEVSHIRFISKDEALNIMRDRLKGHKDMLESLSGNPLPASYQIVLNDPNKIEEIATRLYGHPIVDKTLQTSLTEEMEINSATLTVPPADTTKFSDRDFVKVDDEIMQVSGEPVANAVPVTRGLSGSVADAHPGSAPVYLVDGIKTGGKTTERVLKVAKYILIGGSGFVVLLAVASVLLISNTIRLSIFARRREVEIMRLVGATNSFIRWPFVIEGVATGIVGAAGALVLVMLMEYLFVTNIVKQMPFLGAETVPVGWLLALMIGGGIALGSIGSSLALRRFLRM